jgi:hypothetical protein
MSGPWSTFQAFFCHWPPIVELYQLAAFVSVHPMVCAGLKLEQCWVLQKGNQHNIYTDTMFRIW